MIEEHPAEAARDFRQKFHLSTAAIGDTVTYGEAALLVSTLMRDPTSWLHSRVARWKHPVSWETMTLYDLHDLLLRANISKPADFRPYPRPWTFQRRSSLTAKQASAILKK